MPLQVFSIFSRFDFFSLADDAAHCTVHFNNYLIPPRIFHDASKTGRGRPKGTGLDDTNHIEAIAGLLAANPDMKPTTAIKELGINDPSVIRRLRDKYHASLQSFGAAETTGPVQSPEPARTMAAAQVADHRITAPADQSHGDGADREPAARRDSRTPAANHQPKVMPDQSFAKLFGLGLGVFVSGLEAQASLLAYGVKAMPVGPFFQAQVIVAEAALKFAADLITAPGQLA